MAALRGGLTNRGLCCLALLVALVLGGGMARAQNQHDQNGNSRNPIITGTQQSSMDAPETNNDLEQYAHSAMVQRLAKKMGISTRQASRYFEDFNSGSLIAAILYVLVRMLPARYRERRERIARELVEARQATEDAQKRMAEIENRLASLGGEVEQLRKQAAEISRGDQAGIQAAMEEERKRIVRSAEAEITAAQANAERGLKRFASDLAVERAAARVRLTAEDDRVLIDEFLQNVAAQMSREGKN